MSLSVNNFNLDWAIIQNRSTEMLFYQITTKSSKYEILILITVEALLAG